MIDRLFANCSFLVAFIVSYPIALAMLGVTTRHHGIGTMVNAVMLTVPVAFYVILLLSESKGTRNTALIISAVATVACFRQFG